MDIRTKRTLLFLFGCILTRFLLVYIVYKFPQYLTYFGYVALLPSIGFMYIYLTNSRKVGIETFGQPIWWNDLRPIHSFLYFLFAYLAITGSKHAWKVLLIDVLFGLSAFIYQNSKTKMNSF
jgi:hypothetical protein